MGMLFLCCVGEHLRVVADQFRKYFFQFRVILQAHGGIMRGVVVILPAFIPPGKSYQVWVA